jgi:hypothetical protein
MDQVSPKSINRRDRPIPVRLPIETEIFYAAQGEFVREASTTRTMEQFLMDRAGVPENIQALAAAVRIRAKLLQRSPRQVIYEMLEEKGYGKFLELDAAAGAFCLAWGLDPDENISTT